MLLCLLCLQIFLPGGLPKHNLYNKGKAGGRWIGSEGELGVEHKAGRTEEGVGVEHKNRPTEAWTIEVV